MGKKKISVLATFLGSTLMCFAAAASNVDVDPIDQLIKTKMQQKHIPGLQLAVVKNGELVKQGSYGFADLQHKVAVTKDTLFPINSMTKAFTGVAVLQLAEQGYIRVDDEIGKHLPDLPSAWKSLRINQLMGHSTGLPRILSSYETVDTIVPRDAEASWEEVKKRPLQFTPNSRFRYNQTGYVILGKLIDKYVPEGFTSYITKKQFNPVGMTQTAQAGFDYLELVVPHQARQYIHVGDGKYKNFYGEFPYMLRTAAGMSSTAEELAKYIVSLQQGKLVKDLDTLWTPVRLNNGRTEGFNNFENGYALGWQVIQRKYHPAVSASGANAVTLITYPKDNVSIVVLTNLLGGLPIEFVDDIAAHYIPDFNSEIKQKSYHPMAYLKQLTNKQGFENFSATFAQAQADTGVMYDLEIVTEWGEQLVKEGKVQQGIAIFKFALSMNDEQTYYLSALAEAYEATEQYQLALKYYQRMLEVDPYNQYASDKVDSINKYL
ncbi:serine hydrolase [Pseudoalteromonas sp. JBTF-M23]|uniref:Serine hydrolase n=1 Tax=Pseudoalteromonas caenipelagi TaxID=2726988 RepID=A0A849VGK2_9GAMM|nr:serine hydrolase [Pseudoalteromonas caenipelagi]NOU51848.1 serine hydrolase [Pseudoalteromonas caenipelagi]